jgi:hypothetical protein
MINTLTVIDDVENTPDAVTNKVCFWALITRAVYAKGCEAKNETEPCGRIKRQLKKIDDSVGQTMKRGL